MREQGAGFVPRRRRSGEVRDAVEEGAVTLLADNLHAYPVDTHKNPWHLVHEIRLALDESKFPWRVVHEKMRENRRETAEEMRAERQALENS